MADNDRVKRWKRKVYKYLQKKGINPKKYEIFSIPYIKEKRPLSEKVYQMIVDGEILTEDQKYKKELNTTAIKMGLEPLW